MNTLLLSLMNKNDIIMMMPNGTNKSLQLSSLGEMNKLAIGKQIQQKGRHTDMLKKQN